MKKALLMSVILPFFTLSSVRSMNNDDYHWYEKCLRKIQEILDADDVQKLRFAHVDQFTHDELFIDAVSKGAMKCADYLWKQNLDDEETQKQLLDSSLYAALENSKFMMADFLRNCGANVKTARKNKNHTETPLSYFLSRKKDSSEQVAWLLENGSIGEKKSLSA